MGDNIVLSIENIKCSSWNCNKDPYNNCENCQRVFCKFHLMVTPIEIHSKIQLFIYCESCDKILKEKAKRMQYNSLCY